MGLWSLRHSANSAAQRAINIKSPVSPVLLSIKRQEYRRNRSNYIDVTFKHAGGMFPTFFKI